MAWSFSIGRILGTDLRVHVTFFLLLAWIGTSAWMAGGVMAAISSLAFILALFLCVVLHEFGHALAARRYGIHTPDVTLLPIGGLARLERMPENPWEEMVVAIAGPMVNVVIWLVLTVVLGAEARLSGLENIADAEQGFLARLAAVNLFLVLFNMIPAFPMDGGRVLRAALATRLGRAQATRIAARTGQALAFGFGFLGLAWGNPILVLIAIFVYMAAGAESSDVAMHDLARNMSARDAMITQYEALAPDDSVEAAANALIRTTQHEFPVVDDAGHTLGFVFRDAIFAAVQGLAGADSKPRKVADMMQTGACEVVLTRPLEEALKALAQGGCPAVSVTDPGGNMVGYITRENIGELMVLAQPRRA